MEEIYISSPSFMRIVPATEEGIAEAVIVLQEGGIVAHATETCYGLACDLSNPQAVTKLFAIKRRPFDQPVSALFESVDAAKIFVSWNEQATALASQYLPGPLTLILPLLPSAPLQIFPTPTGGSTLGVRVSPHPVALALAEECSFPLSTTSANIHGEPNPYSAAEIITQYTQADLAPDLLIDSGILPPTPPSTVVDLTAGGEMRRKGGISLS